MPTASPVQFTQDSFVRTTGNQSLEQVRRLKDSQGRVVSQQVSPVTSPPQEGQKLDTLQVQPAGNPEHVNRPLLAMLAQVAQTQQERNQEQSRGFTRKEFDFWSTLFGGSAK